MSTCLMLRCHCPCTPRVQAHTLLHGRSRTHAASMLCRIKAADSAFPHRSTLSSVQWYVSWGDARQAQRCTAWLKVK